MSLPAISVRNLGKMYRLSHQGKRTDSFREAITSALMSPLRRLRQIRGTDETMEEFWALKDVSFDVQPGEVVGIIGRNGAGKSTLLKILSRIVEPTTGEIRMRGRVASLLEVGTGFHPELSGRENIYLNGSILGMKKREIDRKFDEIVDFAEVEKFLDTPVKRYSSGMYVRLAFAVAAHLDPEILIVDEVLAVGDAEFQKKCLGKMKEVAANTGRTVLFVSHNMGAVTQLCSRCVLLEHGTIALSDTSARCIARYLAIDSEAIVSFKAKDFSALHFNSVRLTNSQGMTTKNFHHDEPICVELRYRNIDAKPRTELGLRVLSQEGMVVFTTHRSNKLFAPVPSGLNIAHVTIPPSFLTPGNYSITIAAHVPHVEILDLQESPVAFRIEETGSQFSSYAMSSFGVVFCECEWEDRSVSSI